MVNVRSMCDLRTMDASACQSELKLCMCVPLFVVAVVEVKHAIILKWFHIVTAFNFHDWEFMRIIDGWMRHLWDAYEVTLITNFNGINWKWCQLNNNQIAMAFCAHRLHDLLNISIICRARRRVDWRDVVCSHENLIILQCIAKARFRMYFGISMQPRDKLCFLEICLYISAICRNDVHLLIVFDAFWVKLALFAQPNLQRNSITKLSKRYEFASRLVNERKHACKRKNISQTVKLEVCFLISFS